MGNYDSKILGVSIILSNSVIVDLANSQITHYQREEKSYLDKNS